jgi:hypothetical protein
MIKYRNIVAARGSIVGWGNMLQAWRLQVRFPMKSFINSPNPSSRTMALGSTQPLTEMSARDRLKGCSLHIPLNFYEVLRLL